MSTTLFSQAHAETKNIENLAEDWYKIEVIIFKYLDFNADITKYEPIPYKQTEQKGSFYTVVNDLPLTANQLPSIKKKERDLYPSYASLKRAKNTHILYFQAWKQALLNEQTPVRITINGGDEYLGGFELEGNLFLSKRRFLHANAQLYLKEYNQAFEQTLADWFTMSDALAVPTIKMIIPVKIENEIQLDAKTKIKAFLHQTIRMKRDEVHYMDHPALGVLIKIDATDPPFVAPTEIETPVQAPPTAPIAEDKNQKPIKP